MHRCTYCNGRGMVEIPQSDVDFSPFPQFAQCPVCNPPEPVKAWKVVMFMALLMLLAFITCGGGF